MYSDPPTPCHCTELVLGLREPGALKFFVIAQSRGSGLADGLDSFSIFFPFHSGSKALDFFFWLFTMACLISGLKSARQRSRATRKCLQVVSVPIPAT